MAGGGSVQPGQMSSEPNVIPMIDILLVLLIIFMITQPLARMALDVQVPPPVTAPQTGPSTQIVLEITSDGSYTINGQPVPKTQLDMQIHSIFDARPAKLLFIKTAPNRKYQEVIEAMDVARGAGAGPPSGGPPPPGGGGARGGRRAGGTPRGPSGPRVSFPPRSAVTLG